MLEPYNFGDSLRKLKKTSSADAGRKADDIREIRRRAVQARRHAMHREDVLRHGKEVGQLQESDDRGRHSS